MSAAMIEIAGVSKAYEGRAVVSDLSLEVPRGALCVLLGPSGCGKSTTLRMINRLVPFDAGAIRVGGEDVTRVPPEVLRRRIGYAIQSSGLFPHWRVADNIATVPRPCCGWPEGPRIAARVDELLVACCGSTPRPIAASTRTNCRAASSSGSAWRGRWPQTPMCC